MQQEFAAALYQLMTQARRNREDNIGGDRGVVYNNSDQRIILNGALKHAVDGKSAVEKVISDNMNGINAQGKSLLCKNFSNVSRHYSTY